MLIHSLLLLLAAQFLSAVVPTSENHIVGGERIEIDKAPWQASLRHEGVHICSGSIYSKTIIITAAHCLCFENGTKYRINNLSVSVGSTARSNGTVFQVQAKISYPNYTIDSSENDIAVLRLEKPLVLSDTVHPIALVNKHPAPGTIASATGWGVTGFNSDSSFIVPEFLQGINLEVLSLEYCENFYEDPVPENSICAMPGICDGDSGAPLVIDRELVGVVSASNSNCNGPSISTSVFYLKDWILQSIDALSQ
ncbi:trypsin alpha-like [Drosophila serrata]|uniref:trypsin alpha-like n=1 Tax=Drosophila serrata TaxID=7274 RepID=UPI000A1D10E3|nr:trypsin alpha-like [Drosophila serrata]